MMAENNDCINRILDKKYIYIQGQKSMLQRYQMPWKFDQKFCVNFV